MYSYLSSIDASPAIEPPGAFWPDSNRSSHEIFQLRTTCNRDLPAATPFPIKGRNHFLRQDARCGSRLNCVSRIYGSADSRRWYFTHNLDRERNQQWLREPTMTLLISFTSSVDESWLPNRRVASQTGISFQHLYDWKSEWTRDPNRRP
jgi:hypothetical protein